MAVATIATIPLDILFIPFCEQVYQNGALGGVFSFIITEIGMTLVGISLLPAKTLLWDTFWYALRALVAGIGMILGIWWLKGIFIIFPVALGGVIFISLAFILRLITREEWMLFKQILFSITSKLRKQPVQRMNEV